MEEGSWERIGDVLGCRCRCECCCHQSCGIPWRLMLCGLVVQREVDPEEIVSI